MGIPPFRESIIVHFLIGLGAIIFFAVRALRRNNTPPRWIGDFGTGFLGQGTKWLQWYSWAMLFEFLTSLCYWGTGLFYYEIGMSFIEGFVVTLGAWVADRLVDFFLGISDLAIPSTNTESIKNVGAKVYDFSSRASESVKSRMKAPTLDDEVLKKENKTFEDITKGH